MRVWKSSIILGLIGLMITASNLGCASFPFPHPNRTAPIPNSNSSTRMNFNQTPKNISLFSRIENIPPLIPLSMNLSKTATITPVITFLDFSYTPTQSIDLVWEMLGLVNLDRIRNDLRILSGEEPLCIDNECYTITNRATGSEGLNQAKEYVFKKLVELDYTVEYQDWSRSGFTDQNIIARKPGVVNPDQEIYFIAHLDGRKEGEEERFPAADDDGSGVVDLLELARIFSNYSFSNTIVFLFSTGEEQGTLGVQGYLNELSPEELSSIKYAIDLDMIGYDTNDDARMELWHGGESESIELAGMMSEIIQTYQLNLSPILAIGCG